MVGGDLTDGLQWHGRRLGSRESLARWVARPVDVTPPADPGARAFRGPYLGLCQAAEGATHPVYSRAMSVGSLYMKSVHTRSPWSAGIGATDIS